MSKKERTTVIVMTQQKYDEYRLLDGTPYKERWLHEIAADQVGDHWHVYFKNMGDATAKYLSIHYSKSEMLYSY